MLRQAERLALLPIRLRASVLLIVWLSGAASVPAFAQRLKSACELLTKSDVESTTGLVLDQQKARTFAPRQLIGMSTASECDFYDSRSGTPELAERWKWVGAILFVAEYLNPNPNALFNVARIFHLLAPDGTIDSARLEAGLGDAAIWTPYETCALSVFIGGTTALQFRINGMQDEGACRSAAKKLVVKALGGVGRTGYTYIRPAPHVSVSSNTSTTRAEVEPVSEDALGAIDKLNPGTRADASKQISILRQRGQQVLHCTYFGEGSRSFEYYFWYKSPPPDLPALVANKPDSPLRALGNNAVQTCPLDRALARTLVMGTERTQEQSPLPANCGARPARYARYGQYGHLHYALDDACGGALTEREQIIAATLADKFVSQCHYPSDAQSRAKLERFVSSNAFVVAAGRKYSDPKPGNAMKDQAASQAAFAEGVAYAARLGCETEDAQETATSIVNYLDRITADSRFVAGCASYFSGRYTQKQCQCVAEVGRAINPNINQAQFSRDIMVDIVKKNPFLGLQLSTRCGIGNY